MEYVLWTIYLSQCVYILGWNITVPLGLGTYAWLILLPWYFIFDMAINDYGDISQLFYGPIWRGWFGFAIYMVSLPLSGIPIVNVASGFLMGWWAVSDYYGYHYTLFEGPNQPAAYDDYFWYNYVYGEPG